MSKLRGMQPYARRLLTDRQRKYQDMATLYLRNDDLDSAAEIAKDLELSGQHSALGEEILTRLFYVEEQDNEEMLYGTHENCS